jgi:peptidoglycan/LPS O-acetylase OafA/YrhL
MLRGSPTITLREAHASGRFPCFDGLRAVAALSVVGVHTAFVSGFTGSSSLGIYTSRLEIGVSVFFVISGFLLYRPFALAHLSGRPAPGTRGFLVRRALRLVPAYWVAFLIITYVAQADTVPAHWWSPLAYLGFAQIYIPSLSKYGISQAWSLCTEMTFYLFLPLWARCLGARVRTACRQLQVELGGVAALVVTSFAFRLWCLNHAAGEGQTMPDWLPAYLDLFALGMLLAVVSSWLALAGRDNVTWCSGRWMPWASWTLAAVAFVSVSHLGIPLVPIYHVSVGTNLLRQSLYGIFAFFLVLPAVIGPTDGGAIRSFLRSRPMAGLGVISYGVYLWHQGMVTLVMRVAHDKLFTMPFAELFSAVLVSAMVAATLSYYVVERPAQDWGRRLTGRASTSPVAAELRQRTTPVGS